MTASRSSHEALVRMPTEKDVEAAVGRLKSEAKARRADSFRDGKQAFGSSACSAASAGGTTSRQRLKQAFQMLDHSSNGGLTKEQLSVFIERLSPDVTQKELDAIFKSAMRTGKNTLHLDDLVDWFMPSYLSHIDMLWKACRMGKDAVASLWGCLPYLQSLEVKADDRTKALEHLAMTQKYLLDLCQEITDLRQEIGGHDAVAEPIRPAKLKDVPRHLFLGLRWSGLLRMLELTDLDKNASHDTMRYLIKRSEEEQVKLTRANSSRLARTETTIAMRTEHLKNWRPVRMHTAYCPFGRPVGASHESYALSSNGYDFLDVFVRPFLCTSVSSVGKSMCEVIEQSEDPQDAQKATWFLSHAQSETLKVTLDALCWHLHSTLHRQYVYDKREVYIWTDYGSLRQVQASDFTPEYVACVIQSVSKTVMMVDDWQTVQVASRLWCTFEILNSLQDGAELLPISPQDAGGRHLSLAIGAWERLSVRNAQTGADKKTEARIRASLESLGKDVDFALQAALAVAYTNYYNLKTSENLRALLLSAYAPQVQQLTVEIGGTAALPEDICKCKRLQKLALRYCRALKTLPAGLGALEELTELTMWYCDALEVLPEELGNCKHLETLLLFGCEALRQVPAVVLGGLEALTELEIRHCDALCELPEELGNCSRLQRLEIHDCKALKRLPAGVGRLQNLAELEISECGALRDLPEELGRCKRLRKLLLSCRNLRRLPAALGALEALTELEISFCGGLEELPEELGDCRRLETLVLLDCIALMKLPAGLGALESLTGFGVGGCSSIEMLPEELCQCRNLRTLELYECEALRCLPPRLGDLEHLTLLDIYHCNSLQVLPEELEGLPRFREGLEQFVRTGDPLVDPTQDAVAGYGPLAKAYGREGREVPLAK
eukprot:TRINITY_DN32409_c0_g2_i1.p1 TRINITY_DN32409_c0_g2~~TRINITY_DN32409_c0_g2_i1.p1  ORF type:complete len:895 (+),score=162.44 TRINITY_DN32409_c0_g2_i1:141-2825(+)